MEEDNQGALSPSIYDDKDNESEKDLEEEHQSGRVTFPNSVKSDASSQKSAINHVNQKSRANPFKMPADNDIFLLRDMERHRKKQERLRQRNLSVYQKTAANDRINFRQAATMKGKDVSDEESEADGTVSVKDDPQFTIAVTRDRQIEKESINEYITKKREMFILSYSLGVKKDEMRKLDEIAMAEEKKLEQAEQYLEEDASMFDEFLKENDKNSVEAIRIAEEEAKAKLAKVADIKRLNSQIVQIKSEITKYEELLKDYKTYKEFLEKLMPIEEKERRSREKLKREDDKRLEQERLELEQQRSDISSRQRAIQPKTQQVTKTSSESNQSNLSMERYLKDIESEDEEDLQLYFTDPQELLYIFTELEESNLSLIQNCQETEESLEEMKQSIQATKNKMECETKILTEQIDKLNRQIQREEEKASELETKCKMFSYGNFEAQEQEEMLLNLNKKVEEVYITCLGNNEANISTLQMLTNIENRIEELFEIKDMLPEDRVDAAQKAKDKERRLKMREEKKDQQRVHQEERIKKALERAKAAPKKQTGRRLMPRSNPPTMKRQDDDMSEKQSREEEELAYFFT